ncbi:RNA methyltransferase [candidate division KSB1 bacterium]|nr:RNA methyltransferase [candidate division KSB1 bacterium]
MEQLEGKICVEAALTAHQRKFQLILLRDGLGADKISTILQLAQEQDIPVKYISATEIDAMAHGKTHGGVVALCSAKKPMVQEDLFRLLSARGGSLFLLLLEGVDDSQNLGFVLRTAEAVGVGAVLLKKHLWDFDATAVSRASSGAFERLPLILFESADRLLPKLKRFDVTIYGCIANTKRTIYEADLSQSIVVALGGEKRGLSAAVRHHCDKFLKIPMAVDMGSLSLSHAAAIVLGEVMRQRILKWADENQR